MSEFFIALTLVSNNRKILIPLGNIAFANEGDEELEDGTRIHMTRVFLRQFASGNKDNPAWIDVKETVAQIGNILAKGNLPVLKK